MDKKKLGGAAALMYAPPLLVSSKTFVIVTSHLAMPTKPNAAEIEILEKKLTSKLQTNIKQTIEPGSLTV